MLTDRFKSTHQVIDAQHVSYLLSIAVDNERDPLQRRVEEVCHPSLVFIAKLAGSRDTRHTEHHRGNVINPCVIVHVLIGGALRAAVWRMKIQWLLLRNTPNIAETVARLSGLQSVLPQVAVNLVCRREQQERTITALPHGLQDVERSANVDVEIQPRVLHRCRYRNLRREVIHLARICHGSLHNLRIPNVADRDLQSSRLSRRLLQRIQIGSHSPARQVIENMDLRLCCFQQMMSPVRPDEPGAPEYQYRTSPVVPFHTHSRFTALRT